MYSIHQAYLYHSAFNMTQSRYMHIRASAEAEEETGMVLESTKIGPL